MRFVPDGLHRQPLAGPDKPPEWYVIWLGLPLAEGSVVIGRSKRLRRHREHRFFPESGEWPRDIVGHVAGMEWLLEVHRKKEAEAD
jgi:hypothetical protein